MQVLFIRIFHLFEVSMVYINSYNWDSTVLDINASNFLKTNLINNINPFKTFLLFYLNIDIKGSYKTLSQGSNLTSVEFSGR